MRKREMRKKGREWPWFRSVTNVSDQKFSSKYFGNSYLDIFTKRAAIKAAPSVVSLVAHLGDKQISQCSGVIIESDGTILTSANLIKCPEKKICVPENIKVTVYLCDGHSYEAKLIAYDAYFNIAVLKIEADTSLLMASLRCVDDDCLSSPDSNSNLFRLAAGEKIIALGRYFIKPFDLMVAPGEFSIDCCEEECIGYGCKELFRATCLITRPGEGGPLVNHYGEVIGISTVDASSFTPFLPMNIILKWWEHYKRCKATLPPPELGMEFTNLYAVDLEDMEKVIEKFSVSTGVIVEAVIPGSCADSAGIRCNDLIVECCGKPVRSFLQLFDMMWEKVGSSVELVVLRVSDDDAPLRVTVVCSINAFNHLDCDDYIDGFEVAGNDDEETFCIIEN